LTISPTPLLVVWSHFAFLAKIDVAGSILGWWRAIEQDFSARKCGPPALGLLGRPGEARNALMVAHIAKRRMQVRLIDDVEALRIHGANFLDVFHPEGRRDEEWDFLHGRCPP
jgi:hypothetical protein